MVVICEERCYGYLEIEEGLVGWIGCDYSKDGDIEDV